LTSQSTIADFILDRLAEQLGLAPGGIDRDADLIEMGVKSIDAVLLSGELEDRFGIEVDPVILFECRTVNLVSAQVAEALA
jgi:acyl carrier protein